MVNMNVFSHVTQMSGYDFELNVNAIRCSD